jgi:signal transduction histidine kinase
MLVDFINANHDRLVSRTSAMAKGPSESPVGDRDPEGTIPLFLSYLTERLRHDPSSVTEKTTNAATVRGALLLARGYTVGQVVHDYGALCQAITALAVETDAAISTDEFRTLNKCLDDAIAEAVTEYVRLHDLATAAGQTERSGVFVHELRNKLAAAQLGFDAISSGRVPIAGSVATIVAKSLQGMTSLINRAIIEVRLDSDTPKLARVRLEELIGEVHDVASLDATRRGVMLSVATVDPRIDVNVDVHVMTGVLVNLVQNALKFTVKGGLVRLSAGAVDGHIEINVEDECGGLPVGKVQELFGAFRQEGADRSGLGLGLFISRKGVEASGGSIRVRDIPKQGCVFTIELPSLASDEVVKG